MKIIKKKIKSFDEYLKLIRVYPSEDYYFRGHSDQKWRLVPSIARVFDHIEYLSVRQDIPLRKLEQDILSRFKRLAIPYLKSIPNKSIDWLIIGQHYGLPTRLLDWTENPLVALFFALIEGNESESAVWIINPGSWYSIDYQIPELEKIEDVYLFFPQSIDGRVISQKGCFTIHPIPADDGPFPSLEEMYSSGRVSVRELIKILIPNDILIRKSMLLRLYDLGINHNFVFPDLIGLTNQIKFEYRNGKIKI